jgi:hypothetical protein
LSDQQKKTKTGHSLWLSRAALGFVALAAVMGWGASFVGLHAYGQDQMVGFSYWTAWLIPATFDGAAFGATLITYRASIYGRSAFRGRMLMWIFTAISSWINWIHQTTPEARIVAAGLPVAAVAVFDVVLAELRADYEERHGKRRVRLRPGLLLMRWLVDREGTALAFRRQVTDIPVSEIAGLGTLVQEYEPVEPGLHIEDPAALRASADPKRDGEGGEPVRSTTSQAAQETVRASRNPSIDHSAESEHVAGSPGSAGTLGTSPDAQIAAEQPGDAGTGTVAASVGSTDDAGSSRATAWEPDHKVAEHESTDRSQDADTERVTSGQAQPEEPEEQTLTLPPVPAGGLTDEDKRTFARRDYRLSLEAGEPLTGSQLSQRYGFSERWGRRQIAAVRVEMEQDEPVQNPHRHLVGADV